MGAAKGFDSIFVPLNKGAVPVVRREMREVHGQQVLVKVCAPDPRGSLARPQFDRTVHIRADLYGGRARRAVK
jgi:hypothetical protein